MLHKYELFLLQLTSMPINKPPAFLGIVLCDSFFFYYFAGSLILCEVSYHESGTVPNAEDMTQNKMYKVSL